jgi:hypothetical protein
MCQRDWIQILDSLILPGSVLLRLRKIELGGRVFDEDGAGCAGIPPSAPPIP